MIYIGIDPGQKGAMAVIMGDVATIYNRGDGYIEPLLNLCKIAEGADKMLCTLERVNAMPGNGAVSMFKFGTEFGWCQGILEALQIPYELVTPQRWKKSFGVTHDKNTSISVAKRLFPNAELRRTERCRKDDDNRAEALLMAEYARRESGK